MNIHFFVKIIKVFLNTRIVPIPFCICKKKLVREHTHPLSLVSTLVRC